MLIVHEFFGNFRPDVIYILLRSVCGSYFVLDGKGGGGGEREMSRTASSDSERRGKGVVEFTQGSFIGHFARSHQGSKNANLRIRPPGVCIISIFSSDFFLSWGRGSVAVKDISIRWFCPLLCYLFFFFETCLGSVLFCRC